METQALARKLRQCSDEFIGIFSTFSNEEANTVPFAGSWTAGQVADHIIKATGELPDQGTKPADRSMDLYANTLRSLFLDFSVKFESPDVIRPGDGPFVLESQISKLSRIRDNHVTTALNTDLSVLCLDFEMPGLGFLTRYEWLDFFAVHTKRHTHQLKNIKEKMTSRKVRPDLFF